MKEYTMEELAQKVRDGYKREDVRPGTAIPIRIIDDSMTEICAVGMSAIILFEDEEIFQETLHNRFEIDYKAIGQMRTYFNKNKRIYNMIWFLNDRFGVDAAIRYIETGEVPGESMSNFLLNEVTG